ncbi:Ig-like domain-containing protein [Methanobrevibacter sp.]|uniref:Ig-like domain-containing protein n=1 Tax=Methanobrevibacter sp. TaxID=66852 RepID=UPI00388DCE43
MNRNRIIFCVLIVIVAALLLSVSAAAFPFFGKETAKLNITSNETLSDGDDLEINLTDNNGKPIANVTVNITIADENGENDNKSVVTDENGTAKLKIDKSAGKYTVNCTFAGNDNFEAVSATQNITIEESYEENYDDSTSTEDPGAFYSAQEGRIIYTGEIHGAPDGNRYRHLGYNEWEMV